MRITVEVKGTEELHRVLEKLGERAQAELGKALYAEAELIMTESKKQVPVDTGTLRASGFVKEPETKGGKVEVELGYGGPASKVNPKTGQRTEEYAYWVHERLDLKHEVGKAKFLEDPVKAAAPKLPRAIADRLRHVL